MDGPLEEPQQQQQWDQQEEEEDDESIEFVQIDESAKEDEEDDDQENSDQEEDNDQEEDHDHEEHHLVEGTEGGGEQQERNLTDWSFDGTMDSSAGGQSAVANELVNLRMAALTAKNQVLEEQLKNAQLQAQLAETGTNVVAEVLKEKYKTLESQLEKKELRGKVLEKKLEEKDKQLVDKEKQVAQFTLSLATLGKQLATLSGNSNKIELHIPHGGNHWNLAASSPIFTMNSVGSAVVPSAAEMGGGGSEAEVKWLHGFALKGLPVLDAMMKKKEGSKTTVFYYEVRVVEPEAQSSEDLHYHAIGLSMGYNKDYDDHVGQHPNSYGLDELGQAYYVCGKILHTRDNLPAKSISVSVSGFGDIYGFGLLVKPNKELAIFGTINGMLVGEQIPIQFWSEFLYPTVSVSKLTTKVEANFGNNPTVPFRYDIANCPGL